MPASAPSIGVGGTARAPRLDDADREADRPSGIELRRYEPNADAARVDAANHAYVPGLDGLRALAICVVIAYHLPAPLLAGGFLGVSVFFTLSGYLITSLLLRELLARNAIDLRAFWLRRARRLLPALLLVLVTVLATVALAQPERLATTALEVLGALSYSSNWLTIVSGDDYFRRIAGPGPLDHLWSLAVEEQLYIVWPLLVVALAKGRGGTAKRNVPLAIVTVLLTVASTACIWRLYEPGSANPTRAYEGTDARAAAVLLGAMAALLAPLDRGTLVSPRRVSLVGILGLAGVFGIARLVWKVDEQSSFLYRGGELLLAACSALVAVAATHRHTVVARALGVRALRWIGARSYGLYLWHLPVIAFMPQHSLALHPLLHAAVVVLVVFLFAAASHRWLEEPIRRRASESRVALLARGLALAAVATGVLVVGPMLFTNRLEPAALAAERKASEALLSEPTAEEAAVVQSFPGAGPLSAASEGERAASLTSCREMIHIGDSTSIGLISKGVLPNPEDRVGARYQAVGVEKFFPEISGARSMVETFEDRPNATQVARKYRRSNFKGCWVLALGTNDPANTSGNVEMLSARIATMMTIVGEDPVIWTTTKTRLDKGPYRNANMEKWNQTIADACGRYPHLRVYDWAAEVKDEWFNKDGIHFNSVGCKERAARFARALAIAFPKDRVSPSQCLIRTSTD